MLLRDIERGRDKQLNAVAAIIVKVAPDILLLTDFDTDHAGLAAAAFAELLAKEGLVYPFFFAPMTNAGQPSGLDLDGDGQIVGPGDAWGFGRFPGAQSMVLLSRLPIDASAVRDFSTFPWAALPGADPPAGTIAASDVMRLSYRAHWDVPVHLPSGEILHILAMHATPPVFDGPENANGRRNRDEVRFWPLFLDGQLPKTFCQPCDPPGLFVILGDMNADPADGEGDKQAINALLAHPLVQDPQPASRGGALAADQQGGGNHAQKGDPALDTVDWDEGRTGGNMRVDYVLPSRRLNVSDAGVFWPAPDEDGFPLIGGDGRAGSHHRLVWVDIDLDR